MPTLFCNPNYVHNNLDARVQEKNADADCPACSHPRPFVKALHVASTLDPASHPAMLQVALGDKTQHEFACDQIPHPVSPSTLVFPANPHRYHRHSLYYGCRGWNSEGNWHAAVRE